MGKKHNHSKGFSLVGLLVGIAILAIVLIASGYLVVQSKTMDVRFDLQSELDRAHLLTLQKTRSVKFLRQHLLLNSDPAQNFGGAQPNTALLQCLAGTGTNCTNYNTYTNVDSAAEPQTCPTGGCKIRSTVSYKGNCSTTGCSNLDVRFTTAYSKQNSEYQFRDRINDVKLPAALFANRGTINFGCTANRVLAGVNFTTLQAVCPNSAPNNCGPNNGPLNQYNVVATSNQPTICPPLANQSCPTGLRAVGMFNGQPVCRN